MQQSSKKCSGRSYRLSDLSQINSLGTASGMVSVMVLGLYINSENVNTAYGNPAFLWPVCVAYLYWISRVWMITCRGDMHHDPIVFALRDKTSYAVGLCIACIVLIALYPIF